MKPLREKSVNTNKKYGVSFFVRSGITLVLLAYVFYKSGVFDSARREALAALIASAHIPLVFLSIFMGPVLNFSSAVKWYMLLRSQGVTIRLYKIFLFYIVAKFYNLVLPTSVGGDVVRVILAGNHTKRRAEALASVFVERFSGMATLTFLAAVAVLVNLQTFNMPIITISLIACCLVISIIGWFILDERPYAFIRKHFFNRFNIAETFSAKIDKIHQAVVNYKSHPRALWGAVINSMIFYALAIVNVWVSGLAFDSDLSFYKIVIAVPVIMIIMNLPVSIGGLGLMEFAYVFTFELIGYTPGLGLSTALLMRLKTFIDAVAGGIIHLVMNKDAGFSTQTKKIQNQNKGISAGQ